MTRPRDGTVLHSRKHRAPGLRRVAAVEKSALTGHRELREVQIHLPGVVNFTFGGPDNNVLYITRDTGVWAAVLRATGPEPVVRPTTAGSQEVPTKEER